MPDSERDQFPAPGSGRSAALLHRCQEQGKLVGKKLSSDCREIFVDAVDFYYMMTTIIREVVCLNLIKLNLYVSIERSSTGDLGKQSW